MIVIPGIIIGLVLLALGGFTFGTGLRLMNDIYASSTFGGALLAILGAALVIGGTVTFVSGLGINVM